MRVRYYFEREIEIDEEKLQNDYNGNLKAMIEDSLVHMVDHLDATDFHYDIVNEEEETNA